MWHASQRHVACGLSTIAGSQSGGRPLGLGLTVGVGSAPHAFLDVGLTMRYLLELHLVATVRVHRRTAAPKGHRALKFRIEGLGFMAAVWVHRRTAATKGHRAQGLWRRRAPRGPRGLWLWCRGRGELQLSRLKAQGPQLSRLRAQGPRAARACTPKPTAPLGACKGPIKIKQ